MSDREFQDTRSTTTSGGFSVAGGTGGLDVNTAVITPTDRVRWGPVLAGVLTTFGLMVTLLILGAAVGLSNVDASEPAGAFGVGAGLWGALSALIAFFIGGWMAARTAAIHGITNGILNGGLVWLLTLFLVMNFLTTGINSLLNTAGSVATTAVGAASNIAGSAIEAAAPAVGEAVAAINDNAGSVPEAAATLASESPAGEAAVDSVQSAATTVQGAALDVQQAVQNINAEDVEQVANDAGTTAWRLLLGLGISIAAAIAGGALGARQDTDRTMSTRRDTERTVGARV